MRYFPVAGPGYPGGQDAGNVQGRSKHPYAGGKSLFYRKVSLMRKEWKSSGQEAWIRFEGLPGEYVQVDWGEVRNFLFLTQEPATRYFFCARLPLKKWAKRWILHISEKY
jgi:hypothetical protein